MGEGEGGGKKAAEVEVVITSLIEMLEFGHMVA